MEIKKPNEGTIRFGPFEFDPGSLELRRRGITVRINGQPLEILALLLRNHGALVTREALRQALWPEGTFVDFEHGLNAAIRRLRRALEDDASDARFIHTLPRRGYRFVAPIEADAVKPHPQHSASPKRAIAVLPFENATGDGENDYLVEGMTERLISELALLHELRVMSRSSVLRYATADRDLHSIGQRLGVDAVLVGGVKPRAGTSLRIHAELVDAAEGSHLWGGSYERSAENLAGLAQQIVRDMHAALQVRLSVAEILRLRKPGTRSGVAHREYLKGRYFLNRMNEPGIRRAVTHFEAAVVADRRFALAYCGLADCYSLFAFLGLDAPDVVLPRALEAARMAVKLDDGLAEAHASLASITKVYEWDWEQAEQGYRRALALNPSYAAAHRWYAAHLAAMGRRDQAVSTIERASELDPVSPIILTELAWHSYMAREFDIARSQAIDALDLRAGFPPAQFALALACEQLGRCEEALEAFRAAGVQAPNPAVIASEAHLLASMDRQDEALQRHRQLSHHACDRYVPPYWFAIMASGMGSRQDALSWLERACEQHDVWLVWLKTEPRLDSLRMEPRFQRVLEMVGLEKASPSRGAFDVPRVPFTISGPRAVTPVKIGRA